MSEAATAPADAPVGNGARRTRLKGVAAARAFLCVLVVLAPLLLGGVPAWAPAVLFPVALLAFGFSVWGRRDLKVPILVAVPLGVAAVCLFQLLPLPGGLLDLASPSSAGLRDFALTPLGLSSWRPISLDPTATWREALKWVLYAATVLAALHLTQNSRSNKLLPLQCIAITGGVLVAFAGLHALFDVEELFGFYRFKTASPPLLTPFGNPNHLAGFLILAGTLAGGFLLESRETLRRAAWILCWAACCAGVLISNSRAGIGVFVVIQGALVVSALIRPSSEREGAMSNAMRLSLLAAVAVLGGVGILGERLIARFSDTSSAINKFQQWPHALELVRDCWRFGTGRGAYEVAFTRYYADHIGKTFTHPENLVLQWTAEVGVPLAMAFAAGAGLALYRLWRGSTRAPWELAALLAGAGVALQNLADFNLEFPGVAVPLAAVLGVVAGASEKLIFRRLPLWPLAGALVLVGALGAWRGFDTLAASETRLTAVARAGTPAAKLQAAALPEIDAHPSDYFLYDVVATGWLSEGDPKAALAFANRSLWLFPHDGGAHLIAARALRRLGKRSQALLEYRLAFQTSTNNTAIIREAATWAKNVDELWILADGNLTWVQPVASAVSPELATELLLRTALERPLEPGIEEVILGAVSNLSALHRSGEARRILDDADATLTATPALALARASLERADGHPEASARALDDGLKRWPGHFELTKERVQTLLPDKHWSEARALLARANSSAVDSSQRLALTLLEAGVDLQQGLTARALEGYRTAVRLSPSSSTHQQLASALTQVKHYDEAVAELRAAQRFETPAGAKVLEGAIATIEAVRDADRIRATPP